MNYNLGLVGHPDVNKRIGRIIGENFDNITLYPVDIVDEGDLFRGIKRIKRLGGACNGILYTARDIHYICNNRLDHSIVNTYIESTKGDIFKAIFSGSYHKGADIRKLSVDTLSYKRVWEAFSDLGIGEECSIKIIKPTYTDSGFVGKAIAEHYNNYKYDGSFCITQITAVRDALIKKGVGAVLLETDRDEVIKRINNLISKSFSVKDDDQDQVAITITLSNLNENIVLNDSQHSVILEYNRIMEEVFWFAERVDGAYCTNGNKSYTIFCNRKSIEYETSHFSRLELLDSIGEKQVVYVGIGVGYGRSFKEAIKHSVIANIRAVDEKRNSAYVAYGTEKIAGPFLPSNEMKNHKTTVFDARLEQIAKRSAVSINTIYKINSALKKTNTYTSAEVAQIMGVTRRSANRILEKLEREGFVEGVTMKSNGGRGRPSRIIRFMF